jgi:hypothetical protein
LKTPVAPVEKNIQITGKIPPDSWNLIGTKVIPKIRIGNNIQINVAISFSVDNKLAQSTVSELEQAIDDIGLSGDLKVEK